MVTTSDIDMLATDIVEEIDVTCRPAKVAVFTRDEKSQLYSNAAASELIPWLEAIVERLKSGALRLPVDDGVRYVEEG